MFREIAIISIIASLVSLLIAISFAINDFGIWALVFQNVTYYLVLTCLQTIVSPYLPKFGFSKNSFKELWKFGAPLFMSSSLQGLYSNLFLLLFPKISSLKFSGYYTQANKIGQIPIGIINTVIQSVIFPVLSRIQDSREFTNAIQGLSKRIYIVAFTAFLLISILATELVVVVLGSQWKSAGIILTILSFSGIWFTVLSINRVILKAQSNTNKVLKIEMFKTTVGLLFLLITFKLGNYIILIGIVAAIFLTSLYSMYVISNKVGINIKEQLSYIIEPLLLTGLSCGLVKYFLKQLDSNEIVTILLGLILVPSLILVLGLLFKNETVLHLIILLRKRITNKK